jgi:tRNA(Ile)-lysidine synthase
MHNFTVINKIRDFISSRNLIKPGDKVLVALSGGPDSVFLFHALLALREELRINLLAGHLNHCLRGAESNKDEAFVKAFAKKQEVKCLSAKKDVSGYAKRKKLSIETAARELRREFLLKTADKYECRRIATGHNLNDQAETVLMHIIRGSGLTGLKGVPVVNGRFIRPILGISREEILEYLRQNNIEWREDSSNRSLDHTRNKVRLTLIPQLKKYNPQIIHSLSHLAEIVGSDLELINEITDDAYKQVVKIRKTKINIDLSCFNSYNKGLQRNILRRAILHIARHGIVPSFESIEHSLYLMAQGKVGGRYEVLPGIWCLVGYDSAEIAARTGSKKMIIDADPKILKVPGTTKYNGHFIKAEVLKELTGNIRMSLKTDVVYFDADRLDIDALTIGSRKPGDDMVLFGSSHRKKIKEIFIEAKVPQAQRDFWPVVRSNGQIIWLAGLRRSSHAPLGQETKRILRMKFVK